MLYKLNNRGKKGKNSVTVQNGKVILITKHNAFYKSFKSNLSDSKFDSLFTSVTGTRFKYTFEFDEFFLNIVVRGINNIVEAYREKVEAGQGFGVAKRIPHLLAIRKLLIDNTYLKDVYSDEPVPDTVDKTVIAKVFNWKPLQAQQEAIDKHAMIKHKFGLRGFYIDGQIGSGKTVNSLMIAYGQKSDYIVVFAPNATINEVWSETLKGPAFKHKQPHWSVQGYSTDKYGVTIKSKYNKERVLIVNFESVKKVKDILPKLRGKVTYIVDEAHSLNDKKSTTSKLIQQYVLDNDPHDVILMSGTPLKMSSNELIPMISILDPKFTTHVRKRYEVLFRGGNRLFSGAIPELYARYRVVVLGTNAERPPVTTTEQLIKVKNESDFYLSKIRDDMDDFIERRVKEDVDSIAKLENEYRALREEAFEKLRRTVPINIIKNHVYEVEQVKSQYMNERKDNYFDLLDSVKSFEREVIEPILEPDLRKRFRVLKTMYKYPMLKYLGEALGIIVGGARKQASLAMVRGIDLDLLINNSLSKTLIFSNYIEVAEACLNKPKEFNGVGVYGEYAKNLQQAVNKLKTDSFDFMSASYKTLSTGVPMIMCSTMIAVEKPFRDYIWLQAVGRLDRNGQELPVTIVTFKMDTGEEANIYNRNDDILNISRWNVKYLTSGTSPLDNTTEAEVEVDDLTVTEYYNEVCLENDIEEFEILNEEFGFDNVITVENEQDVQKIKGYKMYNRAELSELDVDGLISVAEQQGVNDKLMARIGSLRTNTLYRESILDELSNVIESNEFKEVSNMLTSMFQFEKAPQPKVVAEDGVLEHEVLPYLDGYLDANITYSSLVEVIKESDNDIPRLKALIKEVQYSMENEEVFQQPLPKSLGDIKLGKVPRTYFKKEFTTTVEHSLEMERYDLTCELLHQIELSFNANPKQTLERYLTLSQELTMLRQADEEIINIRNAFASGI